MDEPSSPEGNAITLRIKFKSASLDEFVARYGADVSAGGIFIRTKQPLAVGTALHFDFTLGDGAPLIAGMGTVVWVREADASRVGSVPGMGVRFDQLTPEGQQTHQKILVAKAKRQGGASTSPPPSPSPPPSVPAAAPAPAPRPSMPPQMAVRPSTPVPPAAVRPSASVSVAPSTDLDDSNDDFGGGGKTEIADRPPSFYFEALGIKPAGASPGKPASAAAVPSAPLDDAETDSQQVPASGSGALSQPIDLGDISGGVSAPVELLTADSKGNELASASPSITDLPLSIDAMSEPASSQDGAVPLTVGKESSWLDDALKATSDEAVPEEAPNEPTQETNVAPDVTIPEAPALQDETAVAASDEKAVEGDLTETPTEDHAARGGKSGKKLIIVGSIAACVAFAGVYLWMAKPWESRAPRSEVPPAAPVVANEPVPTPPAAQPPAPAAQPAAAEPKAAEPVKPSEPTKAAAVAEAEKPREPTAEPAKAEAAGESGKRSGAGKKSSAKSIPAPSAAPSAPAPAPAPAPVAAEKPAAPAAGAELIYFLKIKSVPVGAHITMDGDPMGTTPFQRRILDIDKPHSILVSKPGYDSYERTVTKADFGAPSGNTSTLSISAKLTKLKSQPGAPAPAAAEQAEPAPEQPEKL